MGQSDLNFWLDQIEQFPEREKRERILNAMLAQAAKDDLVAYFATIERKVKELDGELSRVRRFAGVPPSCGGGPY